MVYFQSIMVDFKYGCFWMLFYYRKNMYELIYIIRNFYCVLSWLFEDGSAPCQIPTPVQYCSFGLW